MRATSGISGTARSPCVAQQARRGASAPGWRNRRTEYFRGAINVARVRVWRAAHPGYWRRPGAQPAPALQEDSLAQGIETHRDSDFFAPAALQEVLATQPTVLIGLIAHLTDSVLQETSPRPADGCYNRGRTSCRDGARHDDQAGPGARALAPHSGAVQLGRSALGAGAAHRTL